jgi:membrane associated rhomboid family serine protease
MPTLLRSAERFPVIVTVGLAAVIVTGWSWSGGDIGMFTVDYRVWQGQVWRLLSSVLPHVDIYHLVFNVYWLVVFGSRVEETFGSPLTALWLAVFAIGSQAAEYALARGGVGLSGVGYGLFGFLWVLSKRDPRFTDSVNSQTAQLFVFWFFLCLALTYADIWQVANVAHAAGAVFGALAGLAMAPPAGYRRQLAAGALVCALVAALAASGFARPYVNLTGAVGHDLAYRGYQALQRDDNGDAIAALEAAVRQPSVEADWWHNLGIAYQRASRDGDAERAFRRALELNPTDSEARAAVKWFDSQNAEE